ncbi:MAG TPA: hypothetical protein VGF89_07045 [Steroidobacteraceae bacterium]|jgi:hypothetical protein
MNKSFSRIMGLAGIGATLLLIVAGAGPSLAQESGAKDAMYSYIALWAVPRAKWADFAKSSASTDKIFEQGLADGTLVAYGSDYNLVHEADGYTHDGWWSSHSMAGLMKVLDSLEQSSMSATGPLTAATKHADEILVSRHYNAKPGTYKGAYTHGSSFKLKPDAPDDAVDIMSKSMFDPVFEKLLADGTIVEYEVDEEAVHTQAPDSFWIYYVTPSADGLDKVTAAIGQALKASPMIGPAFNSYIDFTPHRDYLARTTAVFK